LTRRVSSPARATPAMAENAASFQEPQGTATRPTRSRDPIISDLRTRYRSAANVSKRSQQISCARGLSKTTPPVAGPAATVPNHLSARARALLLSPLRVDSERAGAAFDDLGPDHYFFDALHARQLEHRVE